MNFLQFNVQRLLGVPHEDMGKVFKGGGGGKTKTDMTTTTTHKQDKEYGNLLGSATDWLNSGGFDKNYGGVEGFDPVANMNQGQLDSLAGQSATGQGLNQILGSAGMDGLSDMLGRYDPSKTGLNDALGAANERMNFDFGTQVMPGIRQGASDAGQFGSSRHGIAEGLALDRLSQNQANVGAQMAMQDQQAWNAQRASAMNNLQGISQGLNAGNIIDYNANAKLQSQEQSEIQGALEKWAYDNNVDLNTMDAYKQLISGDMGGTQRQQGWTKAPSSGGGGGSAIGSIAGGIAGSFFGPAGTALGSAAGGAIGGAMS